MLLEPFQDWRPKVTERIAEKLGRGRLVVGVSGPQGSGKSTASAALTGLLEERGISTAVLSVDDLYLTHAERQALAAKVHPMLATRGPPGTHDVELGLRTLDALAGTGEVALPRFDKAQDDRAPEAEWPRVSAPVDCVIFEGWCVGARPQPPAQLTKPVNALERAEDPDAAWRTYVNHALGGAYQALFGKIGMLVQLRAPNFAQVFDWRAEAEHEIARNTPGPAVMSDDEIARFVEHYQRLTEWMATEMPARADVVIDLDADRHVTGMKLR